MTAPTFQSLSLICMGANRRVAQMQVTNAQAHRIHGTQFLGGMHETQASSIDHSLARGCLQALPARDQRVLCLSGELWLTRDGDIEDYILGPGRQLAIRAGDLATVQALQPSRFRLIPD